MLGIPPEDNDRFKHWSDEITATANVPANLSDEILSRASKAYLELTDYFRGLVGRMRSGQGAGLLGAMAAAEQEGDRLSESELYANAILLLNAGHETTTNLIGNGTLALLRHPDQSAASGGPRPDRGGRRGVAPLRQPGAIHEPDSPGGCRPGRASHRGRPEGDGDPAAHANRDPAMFPDPDHLDVTRPEASRHVAFGQGPHYCLGAPLARLEGQVAFAALVAHASPPSTSKASRPSIARTSTCAGSRCCRWPSERRDGLPQGQASRMAIIVAALPPSRKGASVPTCSTGTSPGRSSPRAAVDRACSSCLPNRPATSVSFFW